MTERSGAANQTSTKASIMFLEMSNRTPLISSKDFITSMERTVAITHGLKAKTAQRDAVQPVVNKAFGALMGDESVKIAVNNLHSKLLREEQLAENMADKEEFRKAFLWNVAHAAVKDCARQISTDRSGKFEGVNFSNFLKPDNPVVKNLVFKGILKEGSDVAGADGSFKTPDSPLAVAFNAIGIATTHNPTSDSIKQEIMGTKMERLRWVSEWQQGEPRFEKNFGDLWDEYEGASLQSSSKETVDKETAFELLKETVADTLSNAVNEISEMHVSNAPKTLAAGNDGTGVASRFAAAVKGTPFAEFSVAENATEDQANNVLVLLHNAHAFLLEIAKGTAKLKDTGKFGIVLENHQIFTKDDANRLRGMQEQVQA
ncbi:MAG: hypothetical protein LBS68_01105 [Puniceicoccales bacterium]|nr:hypothetical protein [Puniceicoccales bacterium]